MLFSKSPRHRFPGASRDGRGLDRPTPEPSPTPTEAITERPRGRRRASFEPFAGVKPRGKTM